jgi:hypothetical protein
MYACPEAINHYWQALSLLEQTPQAATETCTHTDTILSLVRLPGWVRDEAGKARMLRHLDQALTDAAVTTEIATMAKA